ncbi:MAG: type VII secretion protein EssC [Clostridia bacterium]|nr:type VII secretion protein EssC [Clostridia bacterium]
MYYAWLVCDNRCKDVYLPDQMNWTGEITLGQDETGWNADLKIPIRTLDGIWYVNCPKGFSWESKEIRRGEIRIRDQLAVVMRQDNCRIGILFSKYDIRNTVFKKFMLPKDTRVEIGRDEKCAVCFTDSAVSHVHGALEARGGECVYTDQSTHGSYINGVQLRGSTRLRFGDVITLSSGIKLIYLREIIAINSLYKASHIRLTQAKMNPRQATQDEEENASSLITYHHRMIRIVEQPDQTEIEIEPPPGKKDTNRTPIWLTLGPSMTMILPMSMGVLVAGRSSAGLVMIGTSSVLAVFWGLMNSRYRKKDEAETEHKRRGLYARYISELDQELKALADKELNRLMLNNPDVGQCALFPAENRRRLWERMPSHPDFLYVRLGKGGAPMQCTLTTQPQRLSLIDDPLRDEPKKLMDTYAVIHNAPITLSLLENAMVGILGEDKADAFAKGLAMQLSVLHSYHDVRICVLTEEGQRSEWEWARWLPHVFTSEDRALRMVVSTPASRQDVLSHLDEVLSIRQAALDEKRGVDDDGDQPPEQLLPHYVVICTNPELLENKPLLRSVLSSPLGFTVVLIARSPEMLPKECKVLLDVEGGKVLTTDGSSTDVDYEYPHQELLHSFSKKIAPLRVKAALEDAAIPTLVTFLEIYGVRDVEKLDVWRFWNENKAYEGLKSVIGLRSGAQPFVLDISDKAHGPHGLMAGTTGSGKSVMLETYILSLALNYQPDQVRFILIDYKGGGMAETFRHLPHVTGIIDNLQGDRIINRALASIQGEIHRRERIFRDAGVNNIDDYIRFFGDDPKEEKLPHLIIIVDEFAELKSEQPDFMRELVSASRVGRSLGVHLILATQKPSNSVSDEIWANTNFRICLRVQSRGDSMDMLHRPDAAYIKGMGRCYIQVGNDEIYEQVQTSYSGAAYLPNEPNIDENPLLLDDAGQVIRVRQKKKSNKREYTQMNAVLDLIDRTVKNHRLEKRPMLWLDELKAAIYLADIPGFTGHSFQGGVWPKAQSGLAVPFAMADDVVNQRYLVASVDLLASRNLMIVGLAGSGKTTLILTMATALCSCYDPAHLRLYVLSLSSRTLGCLSAFPQVGEIVYEGEIHELHRVLSLLKTEADARGKRFEEAWTNNFVEYNRSRQVKNLPPEPAIVVFIDRMAQIRELLDTDEERLALFFDLIREGSSRGIFFVITSLGGNEIPLKIRDCFRGIALQMRERSDYSDTIGARVPVEMPTIAPLPGRGMYALEQTPYEIQCALPASAKTDVERAQALTELGQKMADAWTGEKAPGIARIPENPSFKDFSASPVYQEALSQPLSLPLAYDLDSGLPMNIHLQQDFSFLVLGGRKTGKTNTLMCIGRTFAERDAEIFVLGGEEWRPFCQQTGAELFTAPDDRWKEFSQRMVKDYIAPRNVLRKTAKSKDQLAAVAGSHRPFVLLIDNLENYMELSGPNALTPQDAKLLGQLMSEAANFGMYAFASVNAGNLRQRAMQSPLKQLIDQQRGIAMGGKLGDTDPWGIAMPYRQKNAALPKGMAYYVNGENVRQVVLPLVTEA